MITPSSTHTTNLSTHEKSVDPNATRNHHATTNSSNSSATNKSASTQTASTPTLPEPVSDHLFLNNIRPEQAREFLLNHINRKLDISEPVTIKGAADYLEETQSSKETSNQIIAGINKILSDQTDQENDHLSTINDISKNINSGFSEVRDVFKNLNALRQELLSEFNDVQHNVNQFLDNISSNTSTKPTEHAE